MATILCFDRESEKELRVGVILLFLVFYNILTVTISPLSLADTSKNNGGPPDMETYPLTGSSSGDAQVVRKSKVEILGFNLKRHVARLRKVPNKKVELVFLVDSSSSVGAEDFFNELKFVRKLLADFTVSVEATRVAVITFSSRRNVVRHVDHITQPSPDNHKCKLLEDQLARITYVGGGTYTLGALLQAQDVLKFARANSTKAVFLVTDGYSNAGDPRPAAKKLKEDGVEIFTFGIRFGNVQELTEMASDPAEEHLYILESFEEFEALARRALHEDLQIGDYLAQPDASCNRLCSKGLDCCDKKASCKCGTHTGHYACLCHPGFYGTGLEGDCLPCPEGTYKETSDPGDVSSCKRCPNIFQNSSKGSSSAKSCQCKAGYKSVSNESLCEVVRCPPLKAPEHGYFVNENCGTAFNAACGLACDPGFRLVGNSIRLCDENGSWTGEETSCEMKTCSVLQPPRYGKMKCTKDKPMYDVECTFSCLPGYTLVGSSKRTCLPIGLWDGLPVFCRSVACSPLVAPQHGYISPNKCARKKISYGDVCSFSCELGYVISGPKQVKCGDGGTWNNKLNKTRCIDKQPPSLTCPKNIVVNAEEVQMYIGAMVRWTLPEVMDNSGEEPNLLVIPAVFPPRIFLIGTNTITYIAEDKNNNKAECSFKITVRDTYPPTIDLCESPPPVFSRVVPVKVTWPEPAFSDNSGDAVSLSYPVIPKDGFPYGDTKLKYQAKDSSGNINTCVITVTVQEHSCTYPPEPVNGLMNCTENSSQVSCTISCLPGFAFVETPKEVYRCAYDGVWHPSDVFPDCSETELSNSVVQIGLVSLAINKSDLGCSDYFLLDQLQKHFKRKIAQRIDGVCANDVHCSVENPLLTCNRNRERQEEETNRISRKRRTLSRQRRNDPGDVTSRNILVEFQLAGTVEKNSQEFLLSNVKKAMDTLEKAAETGELDVTMGSNYFRLESIHFPGREPKFRCSQGSVPLNNTCVKCPIGTFFNVISEECEACGLGTYQFQEGQVSCLVCPDKTSTTKGQSKSVGECKAQCLPGSFSSTGLEVCQTCAQGFYQPLYAQTSCLECPAATVTWRRGTRHLKDCQEICQPGSVSRTGLRPCFSCPDGYYQPGKGRKVCFRCPNGQPTNKRGAHALSDCSDYNDEASALSQIEILPVNDCFSVPCLHGSTCEAQEFGYVCHCKIGYKGIHCDVDIDECSSQPCFNNATCQDLVNGYKCICESGFTGSTCQTEIDECMSRPCQNGATCVDKVNGFNCKCLPGYAGSYCEVDVNDCANRPCQNGGTCIDKVADYNCQCPVGFSGTNCEINIDDCASNPCRHNATCIDGIHSFRCDCLPGFEGDLCEKDIDECQSHPCLNNATCHNIVAGFLCQCAPSFSGQLCETELSSEFMVQFVSAGTLDFIKVDQLRHSLDQFTLCLWLNTTDRGNYGTPFSYATDDFDNALTLTDYSGFVLYVNSKRVVSDVTANDGQWRHICVVWKSKDGSWSIYKDGLESDKGIDLATGTTISKDGTLILGQEQDRRGSSFSAQESFIGSLSLVNLWSRTLTSEEISRIVTRCDKHNGDVLAWPDFQPGFRGQLNSKTSQFCHECQKDISIGNGTVLVRGNKPGANATYTCYAGYQLTGMVKRICTIFGTWSGNAPKCSRVSCGYPPSLKNGRYTGFKFLYKDSVTYNCSDGFRLVGNSVRTCTADKTWSNDPPICEEITCEPISPPINGKIDYDSPIDQKIKPGKTLRISCQEGYRLDEIEKIKCLETGLWSSKMPICQPKSCQLPPTVPDSAVLGKKRDFKVGDWVKYQCDLGYQLRGNDTIQCGVKSQWVGAVPKCERKSCGSPPKSPNSAVTESILHFGELANYECLMGYELTDGDSQLECLENQSWGGRLAKCTAINCPSLIPPLHGVIDPAGNWTLHSVVNYSCKSGYQLAGVKSRKCLANAEWSGDEPKCHPILCGPPKSIPNGRFLGDDFTVGNTVVYSCNNGYKILGKAEITCGMNGLWILDAPICEPVTCPEPRNQDHGIVLVSGSFFGQRAEYRCLNGYELVGTSSSVCRENGKWDPPTPTCKPVSCGAAPTVESAEVNSTGSEYGSSAKYVCQRGFKFRSNSETVSLFCLENGTWSQPYPYCDIVRCPVPLPIANGNPHYLDNVFNSTVEYYCDKGYRLEGSVQRVCQADGTWSDEKPRCVRVRCSVPLKPLHAKLKTDEELYYGSEAVYTCEIGHEIKSAWASGVSYVRICQEDGTWSGNEPECLAVVCDKESLQLERGRVYGTEFHFGSIHQYACDPGFKLVGPETRECGADKKWTGEKPFCQIIQCPEPLSLVNGNVVKPLARNFGDTITFICDKGHRLVGPKTSTCVNSGEWSHPTPDCVKINCSQPNVIEHGVAYIKSLSYGSVVRYQCGRGYELHGPEERQCQENAHWSSDEPFCRRIQCPTLPKIANSNIPEVIYYSGDVVPIVCPKGYRVVPENATLKCEFNGNWKGDISSRCDRIICPKPNEIKFGDFKGDDYAFQSKITYFCREGFELVGQETLTCGVDGNWNYRSPICVGTKCPPLSKIQNGFRNSSENKYGAVITFSCDPGYVLSGEPRLICQIDNTWSGKIPRCDPVNCTNELNVTNGFCSFDSIHFGSELKCACDEGFRLHGPSVITCRENGKWSGGDEMPICAPVSCPIPASLNNGLVYLTRIRDSLGKYVIHSATKRVSSRRSLVGVDVRRGDIRVDGNFILSESKNEAFLYNDELTYECNDGYELIGVTIRVCGPDGTWSNEDPVCVLVVCEDPPTPSNGYVTFQVPPVYGSEAEFQCDTGYEVKFGSANRRCLSNRNWSGLESVCGLIECPVPSSLDNGHIQFSSITFNSLAIYACDEGFVLEGEPVRTCEANRTWTGNSPECILVECPDLPIPRHGIIQYEGRRTVGSTVELVCDSGYEVAQATPYSITCRLDGNWNGNFNDCVPITCPDITSIPNGQITLSNSNLFESTFELKCNIGYLLVGSEKRVCQADRSWSGVESSCQPVTCQLLTVPGHGTLTLTGITYNSEAKFNCHEGYRLIGFKSTRCLENSTWSNPPPKCQIVTCPNLADIEDVFVHGKSNIFKSLVSFSCRPKYRLNGPEKIECMLNGDWSGPIPSCVRYECDDLPQIENSINFGRGSFILNSTLVIQCLNGFRLEGNAHLDCDYQGHWKSRGIPPRCVLVTCDKPMEIANGFHNGTGGKLLLPGSVVEFECDPGYIIMGKNQSICQRDGKWFPDSPVCYKICQNPPEIAHGKGIVEEHHDGTYELIYTCDEGYKLVGNDRDLCDKDKLNWLFNRTWCERIVCSELISVTRATISITDNGVGSVAKYTCDKGFRLIGNSSLICSANGEWKGRVPRCESLPCLPPEAPQNGFVILKERNSSAAIVSNNTVDMAIFRCAVGYSLVGNNIAICKEGRWLNKPPICQATDSCSPPCSENGVCVRGSCQCRHGYTGPECSQPICILPCLHGGWCRVPYQCQCRPGFRGDRCQIRVKKIISRSSKILTN